MSNTPSKAEIEKLAAEHLKAFAQFQIGNQAWFEGEVEFARAVLAKWGTPAVAGKPVAWLSPWRADQVTTDYDAYGEHGIPLYTAPQPAPAPLSDDVSQKTWALLDELEKLRGADRYDEDWDTLNKRDDELRAAIAAQGGKA